MEQADTSSRAGHEHPPPSAALLAQAATGDTAAFTTLYEALAAPVYGLCLHILGNTEAAQHAALSQLNQDQREALELAYTHGHTCTEAAALLEVAPSAINIRIRQALHSLTTTR